MRYLLKVYTGMNGGINHLAWNEDTGALAEIYKCISCCRFHFEGLSANGSQPNLIGDIVRAERAAAEVSCVPKLRRWYALARKWPVEA